MNVFISGIAAALPSSVVSNKDIVEKIETTEAFIVQRTGVQTRRHVAAEEGLQSLMVPSCAQAISNAGLRPDEIDMLIVNTISPDHHDPSQACLIQPLLQLRQIPVMDIRAQCTGLVYGMDIARQFIVSGRCKHVLVACGEVLSKRMDNSIDGRNLAILLGDGAGAVVLSGTEEAGRGIIDLRTGADGAYYKLLWTESPGSANKTFNGDANACHQFRMNGRPMFNHAVEKITEVCREILSHNHLSLEDIDIVIPHQPNLRILDAVRDNLSIPEDKMWITVHKYGNMASACLPIALSEYMQSAGTLKNKMALIVGYGSGATWGAVLYKF